MGIRRRLKVCNTNYWQNNFNGRSGGWRKFTSRAYSTVVHLFDWIITFRCVNNTTLFGTVLRMFLALIGSLQDSFWPPYCARRSRWKTFTVDKWSHCWRCLSTAHRWIPLRSGHRHSGNGQLRPSSGCKPWNSQMWQRIKSWRTTLRSATTTSCTMPAIGPTTGSASSAWAPEPLALATMWHWMPWRTVL